MIDKSIKLKRTESVLRELIPEALANLSDDNLRNLSVLDVICSKGRYDAEVYLDPTFITKEEEEYIINHLNRARNHIESYIMQAEGWFRSPKLHFKFDHNLEKQNKMDELFSQIEKELEKSNKNG